MKKFSMHEQTVFLDGKEFPIVNKFQLCYSDKAPGTAELTIWTVGSIEGCSRDLDDTRVCQRISVENGSLFFDKEPVEDLIRFSILDEMECGGLVAVEFTMRVSIV